LTPSTAAAEAASEIISDLRIELSGLKRRLGKLESAQQQQLALKQASGLNSRGSTPQGVDRDNPDGGGGGDGCDTFNSHAKPPPSEVLDRQVDAMFNRFKMRDGGFAQDAR
jgi:hypothetical protein